MGRGQMTSTFSQNTNESEGRTPPPYSETDFSSPSPAYDPVAQAQSFDGVIGKRFAAFLIDAVIISLLWLLAVFVVAILGIVTLGLAWLLFGAIFPIVGLGYNALTIGGPNSATIGQRLMGLEWRTWFGGKVSPLVAAFHALLFWFSFVVFFPILLWCLFDQQKRCLHDIFAGVVAINRR